MKIESNEHFIKITAEENMYITDLEESFTALSISGKNLDTNNYKEITAEEAKLIEERNE